MKDFFKELFEYNFNFNQEIISKMAENQDQISSKLLKLHSHIVSVHGIWNSRIIASLKNYKTWDTFSINELEEIDNENYNSSISIIEEYDLSLSISFSTSSGKTFNNSIRDILFQIITHSTYHRGQIATEFRQCNLEPILSDWIYYKNPYW